MERKHVKIGDGTGGSRAETSLRAKRMAKQREARSAQAMENMSAKFLEAVTAQSSADPAEFSALQRAAARQLQDKGLSNEALGRILGMAGQDKPAPTVEAISLKTQAPQNVPEELKIPLRDKIVKVLDHDPQNAAELVAALAGAQQLIASANVMLTTTLREFSKAADELILAEHAQQEAPNEYQPTSRQDEPTITGDTS